MHTWFVPTPAQVDDLGNKVCTAFDQGYTSSQAEAAVIRSLRNLPFTEVFPGAGHYVVSTAVALYCPGYAPKLA